MSEIVNSVYGFSPFPNVGTPPRSVSPRSDAPSYAPPGDTVDFSSRGRALAEAADHSTFRLAWLRAIRDEIHRGEYETPERINGTAQRLLDVLG